MALTIQKLVKRINEAAASYAIGGLQKLRAELHGKRIATTSVFSNRTVFPPWYAFHHGGRTELQFNIGKEDEDGRLWRYGVAFDFASSQALPDPVATLSPKVDRFNKWLRSNRRKL